MSISGAFEGMVPAVPMATSKMAMLLEFCRWFDLLPSLKLTASLPLKMDGWNTILSYWGPGLFSGANLLLVSGMVFTVQLVSAFDNLLDLLAATVTY